MESGNPRYTRAPIKGSARAVLGLLSEGYRISITDMCGRALWVYGRECLRRRRGGDPKLKRAVDLLGEELGFEDESDAFKVARDPWGSI